MRILFLSAWFPIPADNGARLRIANLLRALARQHEVDLLSFAPEPPAEWANAELRDICRDIELIHESPFAARAAGGIGGLLAPQPRSVSASYSPAMAAAARRRTSGLYDVVIASALHMAPYAALVPGAARILEEVELATLAEQAGAERWPHRRLRRTLMWWKTRRYVATLLQQFAAATVVSERERALVERLAPPALRLAVVPNGVDVSACSADYGAPQTDTLIYPGALSYDANRDAVAFFAEAIMPRLRALRPEARLRVTGRATRAEIDALPRAEGVEFTGYLDDIRPAVARAWAEVVPLRKGGGTRLKVLEAMALGTPVVSTPKGVEGLAVRHGQHALVARSPYEFAEITAQLLAQPELRRQLAENGRALAHERYDWRTIGGQLNDLVAAL